MDRRPGTKLYAVIGHDLDVALVEHALVVRQLHGEAGELRDAVHVRHQRDALASFREDLRHRNTGEIAVPVEDDRIPSGIALPAIICSGVSTSGIDLALDRPVPLGAKDQWVAQCAPVAMTTFSAP